MDGCQWDISHNERDARKREAVAAVGDGSSHGGDGAAAVVEMAVVELQFKGGELGGIHRSTGGPAPMAGDVNEMAQPFSTASEQASVVTEPYFSKGVGGARNSRTGLVSRNGVATVVSRAATLVEDRCQTNRHGEYAGCTCNLRHHLSRLGHRQWACHRHL